MAGQFLSDHLGVDLLHENPEVWQLNEDFHYKSDVLGEIVKIPKGFVTDFASVPRLPVIWWLFGGIAKRPAVVHDYLYSCKDVSRAQADAVLREAMEANGDGWFNRSCFWAGVRLGGASHKTEKFTLAGEVLAGLLLLAVLAGCSTVTCNFTGNNNRVTIEVPKTVTTAPALTTGDNSIPFSALP